MSNATYTQFFYTPHKMPVLLDASWVVNADATDGTGVSSLKGVGIAAVFGKTSATAAVYKGVTNNMPTGYWQVFLKDTYYKNFLGWGSSITQLSGSSILVASAGVTTGLVYVITILGTTTTAGWQSLGLPVGITPAVGVSFAAKATTTAAGTGAVQVANANGSGVTHMEFVGDPNLTLSVPGVSSLNAAPYIIFRTMGPTDASTTTSIAVAPAEDSVLGVKLYLSNSSVVVPGEVSI